MGNSVSTLLWGAACEDVGAAGNGAQPRANDFDSSKSLTQSTPSGTNDNDTPDDSTIAEGEGGTEAVKPMSKRQKKRLAKKEQLQARKRARREESKQLRNQKKLERRAERASLLAGMDPAERERFHQARVEAMLAGRVKERARRDEIRGVISNARSYGVCIDLGWVSEMREREQNSLARQLSYSYSALRKCVAEECEPVCLSIVGLCPVMRGHLDAVAAGWGAWPITVTDRTFKDVHGTGDNVVYLTHDSEDVLEELDPSCVYVIGGMVDRNRLKGATLARANELGVRTARFNIEEEISLEKGTPVLTVNHCVEILIQVVNGATWREAYRKVLPERKGLAS